MFYKLDAIYEINYLTQYFEKSHGKSPVVIIDGFPLSTDDKQELQKLSNKLKIIISATEPMENAENIVLSRVAMLMMKATRLIDASCRKGLTLNTKL